MSTATRVAGALKGLKHTTYSPVDCGSLQTTLSRPALPPMVVVTTRDCAETLPVVNTVNIQTMGIGYRCFEVPDAEGRVARSDTTVGILRSANAFLFLLKQSLEASGYSRIVIDPTSASYDDLLKGLKTKQFSAVCVLEDGTGAGPKVILSAANDPRDKVPVREIPRPTTTGKQLAALVLPVPTFKTTWVEDRSWSLISPAYAASPGLAPVPAVLPVVLVLGSVPPEVAAAVRRALLAAPISGGINPCQDKQEDMYRSFLRGAIDTAKPETLALSSLWEHTDMLVRRGQEKDVYLAQREAVEDALAPVKPDDLARAFKDSHDGAACKLTSYDWRLLFSRNRKIAYYQLGLRHLREAMAADPAINTSSDAFTQAAACLRRAFDESDYSKPDCGEKMNGLWTTYYAPYLPLAVIELNSHREPQ